MPAFPASRRIALAARRTPDGREIAPITPVSYTHLTLPTICSV